VKNDGESMVGKQQPKRKREREHGQRPAAPVSFPSSPDRTPNRPEPTVDSAAYNRHSSIPARQRGRKKELLQKPKPVVVARDVELAGRDSAELPSFEFAYGPSSSCPASHLMAEEEKSSFGAVAAVAAVGAWRAVKIEEWQPDGQTADRPPPASDSSACSMNSKHKTHDAPKPSQKMWQRGYRHWSHEDGDEKAEAEGSRGQ